MLGTNTINKDDILIGTGVLYINNINVGQLSGDVTFTPTAEFKDFEAGIPKQTIKSTKVKEGATLKAGVAELNPENMALAVGSASVAYVTGTVTAEPVVFGSSAISVAKNRHITDLVVTVGATPAVLGTDYEIVSAVAGKIKRIATSTVITLGGSATIAYKFRKSATITSGGGATLPEYPCKYIYASPDGDQEITLNIYLGQLKGGQAITFKEGDYIVNDFEITATSDTGRPAGDQLYSWEYEYFPE